MEQNLEVTCPSCKNKTLWSGENSYRPFCSQRCKDKDFIGWANEEKVMKGNSLYDDVLSGDLGPVE